MKKTLAFISAFLIMAVSSGYLPTEAAAEADYSSEVSMTENGMKNAEESVRAFVDRLYNLVLGRNPDPSGFESWTRQLLSGERTASQVSYGIIFSREYSEKETSDEDYVEMMYNVIDNSFKYSYYECMGIIESITSYYFSKADFYEADAIMSFHRFLKSGVLNFQVA